MSSNSREFVERILRLPWRSQMGLLRRLDALPGDWQERTDEEVLLWGVRELVGSGMTIDAIEEAIARVEDEHGRA